MPQGRDERGTGSPSICFCSWGGAAASMDAVKGSCPCTWTAGCGAYEETRDFAISTAHKEITEAILPNLEDTRKIKCSREGHTFLTKVKKGFCLSWGNSSLKWKSNIRDQNILNDLRVFPDILSKMATSPTNRFTWKLLGMTYSSVSHLRRVDFNSQDSQASKASQLKSICLKGAEFERR